MSLATGLVAALLAVGAAGAAAQSPVEFEARVEPRLGGDADGDGIIDGARTPATALENPAIEVQLEVTDPRCGPGTSVDWRLNGIPILAEELGGCRFAVSMPEGEHELEASVGERSGLRTLRVRDHLVVSLGDSVASGEGNPDRGGHLLKAARWLDRRCHRSMRSAAARAALDLERGERHSRVTLVPLGCSGASIPRGLLGSYAGFEPVAGKRIPPQVERLDSIAERREVDAVVVNVGGNDVRFAGIVRFCVARTNCPDKRFEPGLTREAADPDAPTLAEFVAERLDVLSSSLDEIAERMPAQIPPERIVLVEYFDPTTGPDGFCRIFGGLVSRQEAAWAQREVVAALNATLRDAAARHGWRLVDGVADRFAGHGICAGGDRWVVSPTKSIFQQSGFDPSVLLSGTLHPNGVGHRQIADLIRGELAAAVEAEIDEAALSPFEDERGGPSGLAWFLIGVGAVALLALATATAVLVHRAHHRN